MPPTRPGPQFQLPVVGSGVKALIAVNVVCYVAFLIALRAGLTSLPVLLSLHPPAFFTGSVWQAVTAVLLHDPGSPSHLVFNVLFLWLFGSQYEGMVGTRKLFTTYAWCALGGVALALLLGGIGLLMPSLPIFPEIGNAYHLGASGAVMGLLMAWAGTMGGRSINFFLLGEMKARTFALIIVAIELIRLLSFDTASASMHLGGMAMGWAIGTGRWPPDRRTAKLQREKKRIEKELRRFEVIEGGRTGPPSSPPRGWVGPGGQDDDGGPLVH